MFRANSDDRFDGPHQKSKTVYAGANIKDAKGAMIMIHGRGATAESIITLADEFEAEGLLLAAPQANQFQWYPHSFLAPTERNEPGLSSGLQAIYDIVTELVDNGISKEKIILLGFSQGACLATEFVVRHPAKYGGLCALSGGVIGDEVSAENYSGTLAGTPAFLGCSNIDPHIPKERVDKTEEILSSLGADVTKKIYQGMGHTVNEDEIAEVKKIINIVTSS